MSSTSPKPLNLSDIQGDILVGLVKKTETYLFFEIIGDVAVFQKQLSKLLPSITSATQVLQHRDQIAKNKKENSTPKLLKISAVNIAFARRGIRKIGILDEINDDPFDAGMLAGAEGLGDKGNTSSTGAFTPDWLPAFAANTIDGLIIISGESHATVQEEFKKIEEIFLVGAKNPAIKELLTLIGDVRPGAEKGHEHFGFLDGISQPAVQGVDTKPFPGQETVPQGIILAGRDGDTNARPPWALDGSFLAFRYLSQLVPEFNAFCNANAIAGMPQQEGADFFGARMMGRWKSGAPLDLAPVKDDPALGADPQRNNDFRYGFPNDAQTQDRCPFAAHLRKTNPRLDLEIIEPTSTQLHRIIRRGIQFGPEVTAEEVKEQKTINDRGLFFVAYQSNIANGFNFQQETWSNNKNFPPFKLDSDGNLISAGFDPIIGQTSAGGERTTIGLQPANQSIFTTLPTELVVPRGGEYFFMPSIPALISTFALLASR